MGRHGDSTSALAYLNPALALARETQDDAQIAKLLNAIGEAQRVAGNMEAAQPFYEEALALARAQKKAPMIASIGDNLARVFIPRGMPERARQLLLEVFAIAVHAGSKWVALCALDITAVLAAMAMDWTFAARMRGAAEARVEGAPAPRTANDRTGQLRLFGVPASAVELIGVNQSREIGSPTTGWRIVTCCDYLGHRTAVDEPISDVGAKAEQW